MTPASLFDRSAHFSSSGTARSALERDARHIARFLEMFTNRDTPAGALEELYLIRVDKQVLWELIGIGVRGHPNIILGAVELQRHTGASASHGRTMIGQFLSRPPRYAAVQGVSPPPGLVKVAVPRLTESMSAFFERLGAASTFGPVFHVDAELIDFAFDFRESNPSELEHMKIPPGSVNLAALRTVGGHVLTATGHGLYYTLQRDASFVTVTDVVQHRPERSHRLPTLCIHRKFLALERQVAADDGKALDTLAFHPATARDAHLFGAACGEILG